MKCRNFGKENKLLLFDILDYLVDQGSANIWICVSSKKFFTFILDILKTQNDAEIQTKLLQLIQNWGNSFQNKKDIVPNFFKIYNKFKMNGVVFPPKEQPNYYNYISKNNPYPQNYKKEDLEDNKIREENNNEDSFEFEENNNDFEYIESIKNKLKVSNFESKYRRLVTFLVNMHNNIKSANILIDRKDLSKLKEPINTIKKGNKTLIDTVSSGRLKDEKLMEITLATTEDINQTLSREEELKKGNMPNKFISNFVLNDIIPIGNKSKTRAKSERKKGILKKRNIYDRTNKNNFDNNKNDEIKMAKTNIKNVDDIFDLFSNTNTNNNLSNNNNQNNNMISNYYTNQNLNNQFIDLNKVDDNRNNRNNGFNNYNINNEYQNEQMNNINRNYNRNYNTNNNNFNISNPKNKMIDLFQDNPDMNQQNINYQNENQNYNNPKSDEFDIYGPAPEIKSEQLVNYIGNFNNNNNNNNDNNQFNNNSQFNNYNNNQTNNNFNFGNNQGNDNNYGNNMEINNNNNQMTQEEIEREQRLKELDELF